MFTINLMLPVVCALFNLSFISLSLSSHQIPSNSFTVLKSPEFWKMLVQVVHALCQLNSWEAIRGIGVWLKLLISSTPPWITAAELHAKGSYESACEEYLKALEMLPSSTMGSSDAINAPVIEFIVNRVRWSKIGKRRMVEELRET